MQISLFNNPQKGTQTEIDYFPFAPYIQYNHPLNNESTYLLADCYLFTQTQIRNGGYVNNYRPTAIPQLSPNKAIDQNEPRTASY